MLPTNGQGLDGFDVLDSVIEFPSQDAVAAPRSSEEARVKNTEAQRRFRARLKANKQDLAKKLEEVNAQLSVLQGEKQELERHHGRISHILDAQITHIEQLFSYPEVRDVQQQLLLKEMSLLVGRIQGRQVALQEAMKWTMHDWVSVLFKEYMARIGTLYQDYCSTNSLAALTELQQLISMRHDQEKLGEQFSCMGWALYAWNLEETQKLAPAPPQSHWKQAMEGLALSLDQRAAIVKARSSMISKLKDIAASRADILARLGLQLLDYPREQLHLCPATRELRDSLEKERTAVYTFVVTVCDATLTAVQEAFLDAHSWPWCADLLAIADLLAAKMGTDDSLPLAPGCMDIPGAALAPLLPHASAFKVLATPITAAGGIVLNPVFTVEPSLAFPLPGQSLLRDMPLVSVHAGAWKEYTFWQWTTLVRKYGQPFPNPLAGSAAAQPGQVPPSV